MNDEVMKGWYVLDQWPPDTLLGEKAEFVGKLQMGVVTTYDPSTDTFFNTTTLIGGPFSPFPMSVDAAIEMVRDARRRHGLEEER